MYVLNDKLNIMKIYILIAWLLLILCSNCKDVSKVREEKLYFDNGNIRSIGYKVNGNPTGKYLEYYPNGNLKFEAYYKNGLQDSIQRTYYSDGQLFQIGFFRCGKLDGITETYDENGKLKRKVHYIIMNDTSLINEFFTFDDDGIIKKDSSVFFVLEPQQDTINYNDTYSLKISVEASAFNIKPNMKVAIENLSMANSNEVDTLYDIDDNKRDLSVVYKTSKYKIGQNVIKGQIIDYIIYYNNDSSEVKHEVHKMWFKKAFYVLEK